MVRRHGSAVLLLRLDMDVKIKSGIISRKDIMHLNREKDKVLIGYLITHAAEPCRSSMMKYAAEKYGLYDFPEQQKNIDDPNDPYYEEYFVLQEQVIREDDADVLKEAALHSSDYDMAAFAFCRLTGYRFPPSNCDAYSYRTFDCGIMPGMTAEDIREFCRMMIKERGRFANVAEECLRHQKDPNQ